MLAFVLLEKNEIMLLTCEKTWKSNDFGLLDSGIGQLLG